jgi:transposase
VVSSTLKFRKKAMTQIRTEKEMFPMVEKWLASGITQKAFSQSNGLALHIMPYWVARYRKVHGPTQVTPVSTQVTPATSTGFIQLPTPQSTVSSMEVALPSGAVVRFSSLIPVSYLQELLSVCSR